ncbi:glycosyltransferase [Candidatus Desantisbacteria bacterium]|nr:glycosyltransferase [Candidatus Desantisbacteria bacterium]
MNRPGISVIIITHNEEKNILECLKSVKWADEIVVVDSFSTDDTKKTVLECIDRVDAFCEFHISTLLT